MKMRSGYFVPFALALAMAMPAGPAHAISLQFDYSLDSSGFFTPTRRTVLEAAGSYFNGLLTDTLDAITSSGSNQFNVNFTNPASLSQVTLPGFSVAANSLVVYVGGTTGLGGSTLAIGGPGGFSVSGSASFVNTAITRGEVGATSGPTASEFAPWGGSIAFNSAASWYFDNDVSTTEAFGGSDFFSVALHELGHVLGIGIADSWFRLVSGNVFTGSKASAANGGSVLLDAATGNGHWAEGVSSSVAGGGAQEAAMDPTLLNGTRKRFTRLDTAALDDIGWDVAPEVSTPGATKVPTIPHAGLVLLSAVLALLARRRLLA